MQQQGDDQAHAACQHAATLESDTGQHERAADQCVGQRAEVGAEHVERGVAQEQRQAKCTKDLRQHWAAHDVAHQQEVAHHAQRGDCDGGERHRGPRPAAQRGPDHDGGVHAEHDEIAVSEIHDIHHAPDKGEP